MTVPLMMSTAPPALEPKMPELEAPPVVTEVEVIATSPGPWPRR